MNRRDFIWSAGVTVTGLTGLSGKLASARMIAEGNAAAGIYKLPLLFGTDYYPDQTPEKLWEQDAEMMEAFGITNVRIAEFAWALMEPQEGKFDFAWLNRAVKILMSHNIAVILGTPSAAPPPWLTQKYPEVMIVNEHGVTLTPGTRRFTCPTNKTYRRLSLSMATEMAKTFAATAGVIGWQIDNEQTLGDFPRCYCRFCRAGFQEWLKEKYKTLEAINEAWGTVFWSQTYSDFSQIPVPLPSGSVPNPGLALDYDRYESYANVTFMEEQLALLRKECPNHFVTTNNVSGPDTINLRDLFRNLDFVSHDNYPGFVSIFMNGPDSGMSLRGSNRTVHFVDARFHAERKGWEAVPSDGGTKREGGAAVFCAATGSGPIAALVLPCGGTWSHGHQLFPVGHGEFWSRGILARNIEARSFAQPGI